METATANTTTAAVTDQTVDTIVAEADAAYKKGDISQVCGLYAQAAKLCINKATEMDRAGFLYEKIASIMEVSPLLRSGAEQYAYYAVCCYMIAERKDKAEQLIQKFNYSEMETAMQDYRNGHGPFMDIKVLKMMVVSKL